MHYFPDPDSPEIEPFVRAFLRLMFAHAEFEERVRDLQGIITGDWKFGERRKNQRVSARDRPEKMKKLIAKNAARLGETPETDEIADALQRAIAHCNCRNLLAHGSWWRLDPAEQLITVRAGTDWPGEDQHKDLTAAEIEAAAMGLYEIENRLCGLQKSIAGRLPPDPDAHAALSRLESDPS